MDLSVLIGKYLNQRDRITCLGAILTIAVDSFRSHYWRVRCQEFAKFELSKGITQKKKTASCRSVATTTTASQNPDRVTNNVVSVSHTQADRWKSWVAKSLTTGLNWLNFRIYINSL